MSFFRRFAPVVLLLLLASVLLYLVYMYRNNQESLPGGNDEGSVVSESLILPAFQADSARQLILAQVQFGPRIPSSPAQKRCAEWMESKLAEYTDTAWIQKAEVIGYDGKRLPCMNVIGRINPNASRRVLLTCHWDSRPWADMESSDSENPIDGANDGASGVGVWLEVARLLHQDSLSLGIDFVFFDVEDYGKSGFDDSYCLGSQFWGKNPHVPGFRADFCINLDMVGGRGARFHPEQYSVRQADWVRQMIWYAANETGNADFFQSEMVGPITDDHYYVHTLTGIPAVDLIDYSPLNAHGFGDYWHTRKDNLQNIDLQTLKAVGQTMVHVIWHYNRSHSGS